MVWTGHLEKLLEIIARLPYLSLEIVLGGGNVFLIRGVCDRTTSEMRGLSLKIISGDSR
jgi:hypothetical protein